MSDKLSELELKKNETYANYTVQKEKAESSKNMLVQLILAIYRKPELLWNILSAPESERIFYSIDGNEYFVPSGKINAFVPDWSSWAEQYKITE